MTTKYLMAVAALLVVAACADSEAEVPVQGDDTTGVRIVNVEVTTLAPTDFTEYLRVTGEAAALHNVTLSAEEMGQVTRFLVEKGARVRAGQVIAELDASVLRAQVDEARAAAELAAQQFERQGTLWEDQRIGSEMAFLQSRSASATAAARLAQLEARLENTRIRAPVDGVLDARLIEAGEMATPGMPIARVISAGRLKIEAGVPERAALAIRAGSAAIVTFDVLPGQRFAGRVTFVAASVDRVNRTVPVEIQLDDTGNLVKAHMVANVELVREQRTGVLVVPQQAVLRTESGYQVFVVEEREGRTVAAARAVRLGPAWASQVVIEEGLAPGDRLIRLGQQLVDPNTRVRVVAAAAAGRN
ncbi:MAG: efflux RND transporter periplasmic adaptor subunit [Gemmatimonadales bacterium]